MAADFTLRFSTGVIFCEAFNFIIVTEILENTNMVWNGSIFHFLIRYMLIICYHKTWYVYIFDIVSPVLIGLTCPDWSPLSWLVSPVSSLHVNKSVFPSLFASSVCSMFAFDSVFLFQNALNWSCSVRVCKLGPTISYRSLHTHTHWHPIHPLECCL